MRGSNDAGDVRLSGEALGDTSFFSVDPTHAVAEFEAHTSGDGHDIEIGSAARPARAVGGRAEDDAPFASGDGEVLATGIALGNSSVHIDVTAQSGDGQEFESGDATAQAEGSGGGTEAVEVIARAIGDRNFYGFAGDSFAEAEATGLGAVTARAFALGGIHDRPDPGGAGLAIARASGASGEVEAVAAGTLLYDGDDADDEQIGPIEVGLRATVAGDTAVSASSHLLDFGNDSDDPSLDGFIRIAHHADAALLGAALAGNPLAESAGLPNPQKEVFGLVELALRSGGGVARTFTADVVLGDTFGEFDDEPAGVLVSFLDPELDEAAFGSLTLRSWDTRNPGDVYEISFATALDALAFFDDGRLAFGGLPRQRHLEIVFETTGAEGAFFVDFLVAAVPEPSGFVLLALAAFAARRVVASRPS